jgi:putative transcriptional regulator
MIKHLDSEKFEFNNNLKEIRTNLNYTQQQLADVIGVSRNTISSIERRIFIPTAKLALILCIALEVSFEDIFYFEDS